MTREEIIEYWEQFSAEIDYLYNTCSDAEMGILEKQREVVEFTISALRELDAREAEAKPMNEWISVKDRLPEPNVIVLCCTNKGSVDTDSFGRYSKVFLKCDDMEGKVGQVIAWMPLPEPPKEE